MSNNIKPTETQISNWRKYEKVRKGGKYNMFDNRARIATGLSKEDYLVVMSSYSELRDAAEAIDKSPAS